jgi:hypothetical protein
MNLSKATLNFKKGTIGIKAFISFLVIVYTCFKLA